MKTISHRLIVIAGLICIAASPLFGVNPPGTTTSTSCTECGQCTTLGTGTGAVEPPAYDSFKWEIKVGLARYPKPASYTDMAQAAYEKDGNLPTLDQMIGRYFPGSPLQQSQIPLKIAQAQISAATFHPSCLFLQSEAIIEVLRKSDAGGDYIHQILTDDAFTLVELAAATTTPPAGSGWRIRVWKRNAGSLSTKDGEGFYVTGGTGGFESSTALADVTFRHEAGSEGDNNKLIYTQNETTGSITRTTTKEITQTLGNSGYDAGKPISVTSKIFAGTDRTSSGTLLSQENLVYTPRTTTRLWDYIITRDVFTASVSSAGLIGEPDVSSTSDDLTSHTVETYQDFSDPAVTNGGEMGMNRLVEFSQSGQTTRYTYVAYDGEDPDNAIKYGRLASVIRPDGSWSVYTYGMGAAPVITEYSSWLDVAAGVNEAARKVETTVSDNEITVKTLTARQLTAISQTTLTPGSGTNDTLVTTRQWDGTGSSSELTAANSLTTTTAYYNDSASASPGRVHRIGHPDGTATTYAYGTDTAGKLVVTVCTGAWSGTSVTAGTEVKTTYGLGNIPIAETTKDIATNVELEGWVTDPVMFDPLGRPGTRVYNGNENDYDTSTYNCCGLEEFRARDGSTTHYYRDPLKRVYKTTTKADNAAPVVATNITISGLTTSQTRSVGSRAVFLGSTTRSLDGRTTTTISPSRKSNNADHRLVTRTATTYPSGTPTTTESYNTSTGWTTTSVTTHYLDGQVKSVSGDAVTDVEYVYATHNINGGGLKTSATISGMTTSTDTYTDPLGRAFKTVSPAAGATDYTYYATNAAAGSHGKLHTTTDDDGVTATYQYNTQGERNTTIRTVPTGPTTTATQTTVTTTTVTDDGTFGDSKSTYTTVNNTFVSESLTVIDTMDGFTTATRTPTGTTWTFTTRPNASGVATSTTTRPDGTRTVTTTTHGRTTMVTEQTSGTTHATVSSTAYDYDPLQRLLTVTDLRTGPTTYDVDEDENGLADVTESGQPLAMMNAHGDVTSYAYDILGRLIDTTLPDANATHAYASYLPTGRVEAKWGGLTYPVLYEYNEQGNLRKMRTWRNDPPAGKPGDGEDDIANADSTEWVYYADTGLLHEKLDADGKGPTYTYTDAGRLETRVWARPADPENSTGPRVTTTYGYQYGFLTSVAYTNEPTGQPVTPNLGYFYDYLGRLHTATQDGQSEITYTYSSDFGVNTETVRYDLDFGTDSYEFTRVLDRHDRSYGRDKGWDLKDPDNNVVNTVSLDYDTAGRLATVENAADTFTYGYAYSQATASDPRVGAVSGAKQDFMPYTLTKSVTGSNPILQTVRTYEARRDVLAVIENNAGTSTISRYTYNVNEIGQRKGVTQEGDAFDDPTGLSWGYNPRGELDLADHDIAADDRAYKYDSIGNRKETVSGTITLTGTDNYVVNQLNQYTVAPGSSPAYDDDGNLEGDGTLEYFWDAENRLILVTDGTNTIAEYAYDYLGRRITKTIGSDEIRVYCYDGWNLIAEYLVDRVNDPEIWGEYYFEEFLDATYTWGLDLSGSLQGAGGVGGLLAAGEYYPTFDGNGNVSEYLNGSGVPVAHYEFDPFGNLLSRTSGTDSFNFRFSTKYHDGETGFYYYGYRYYDPLTGRWPSRDPIEEDGGVNLYAFVGNDGVGRWDAFGLLPFYKSELKGTERGAEGCFGLNFGKVYTDRVTKWFNADIADKFKKQIGYSDNLLYDAYIRGYTLTTLSWKEVPKTECESCRKWITWQDAVIRGLWFVPYSGTRQQIIDSLKKRYHDGFRESQMPKDYPDYTPPPTQGEWGRVYKLGGRPKEWLDDDGKPETLERNFTRYAREYTYSINGPIAGNCVTLAEKAVVDQGGTPNGYSNNK
jgi:RHS repeat-associated protein